MLCVICGQQMCELNVVFCVVVHEYISLTYWTSANKMGSDDEKMTFVVEEEEGAFGEYEK